MPPKTAPSDSAPSNVAQADTSPSGSKAEDVTPTQSANVMPKDDMDWSFMDLDNLPDISSEELNFLDFPDITGLDLGLHDDIVVGDSQPCQIDTGANSEWSLGMENPALALTAGSINEDLAEATLPRIGLLDLPIGARCCEAFEQITQLKKEMEVRDKRIERQANYIHALQDWTLRVHEDIQTLKGKCGLS